MKALALQKVTLEQSPNHRTVGTISENIPSRSPKHSPDSTHKK